MAYWFWIVVSYSFFGYLLERMFAKVTAAEKQVRKCLFLLPLCPVYGLAMGAYLALLPAGEGRFWVLALWGAAVVTGVEYLVHLFYDRVLHVRFWDYTGLWGSLQGRVCLPFTVAWGVLSALGVLWVQPELTALIARLPPALTYAMALLLAADAVLSWQVLRLHRDTELLSWRAAAAWLSEDGPPARPARPDR